MNFLRATIPNGSHANRDEYDTAMARAGGEGTIEKEVNSK